MPGTCSNPEPPSSLFINRQLPLDSLTTCPAGISSAGSVTLRHPLQVHLKGGILPLQGGIQPPTQIAPCLMKRVASDPERAILSVVNALDSRIRFLV